MLNLNKHTKVAYCFSCSWAKSGSTCNYDHLKEAAKSHSEAKHHNTLVVELNHKLRGSLYTAEVHSLEEIG